MTRTASLSCSDCRNLLPRFSARELPPELRSRVAAHLDDCDACYRQVQLERELSHELRHTLPAFGQIDRAGLEQMWGRVQSGLAQPRPAASLRDPARLGACAVMIAAALLFATLFAPDRLARALPLPPTPLTLRAVQTQSIVLAAEATPKALSSAPASEVEATPPDGPMLPPTTSATQAPVSP